ncbi:MAG TPA: hypothetical protein VF708_10230 [Pyrinomonadaceae bacterium]|jgi:hypothetical protein
MIFKQLLESWDWKPIRNCPGRFVLSGAKADLSHQELLGEAVEVGVYRVDAAQDTVLVAKLDDGGLISYHRADGSFVHTLNTPEGFRRKLRQLGIDSP